MTAGPGRVREPAVAGAFYPADPVGLRVAVETHLDEAGAVRPPGGGPKAVVAPHAGYDFSGPVAAQAYACVRPLRGRVERVVLLGPGHRFPRAEIVAPATDAWATPLGLVPVDAEARRCLVDAGLVVVSDDAHAGEHSLEVQLPFVQVVLGPVRMLPLVVGRAPVSSVADVLDAVWGGNETLIVLSTDLSHYHERSTAEELDRRTAAAIVAGRAEALGPGDACGVFALGGLLEAARRHALRVGQLDLRTSADTACRADRVVGYGAFALS
ncbi:MAG TPA: AmmeMemoRadiSam system protein B [Acidimicrobiales bacterium]|nr:AmmeMemoRadiSam system protein B [Acidimicrobiales bacterium]